MEKVNGEVKIKCQGVADYPLEKFSDFQMGLKILSKINYEKMKREMLELGFSEPISVWKNKNIIFILNGHQRIECLRRMKKEGYKVPDRIPINFVSCSNETEAKKKILALASQYGTFDQNSLSKFIESVKLTWDDVRNNFDFPGINFSKLIQKQKEITDNAKNLCNFSIPTNTTLIFFFENASDAEMVQKILGADRKVIPGKLLIDALKK